VPARDQASKQAGQQQRESESESSSSSKADPQVHTAQYTHTSQPTQRGYCSSSVLDHTPPANTVPPTARVRPPSPALPCPAEYIASYSTPDRPTTSLPLIHTRVLSIRDLLLRLSDHCNAHCLSAIGAHDILELSKLYSWIALLQLQPALDTGHPIPHRACTALRRKLELGHLNQRASIRTQIIGCKSTDHHTQNTPSGTCLRRPQLLTGRPHTIGYYQPDWRPTTAAAPNAG
jgi:hypothetical protein